jgi:NAD(P)H-dependent FMN reductase
MKIDLIIGSTRPGRIGPQVADWIIKNLPNDKSEINYEIVDISLYNLPHFDEPIHPSLHNYKNNHTKKWSEKISEADGYIFLTSEYNAGYPASLKNAIDYLSQEWKEKPVMIVSYGYSGGVSASAQLRQVVQRLKMKPTPLSPALLFTKEMLNDQGQLKDIDNDWSQYVEQIRSAAEQLTSI